MFNDAKTLPLPNSKKRIMDRLKRPSLIGIPIDQSELLPEKKMQRNRGVGRVYQSNLNWGKRIKGGK